MGRWVSHSPKRSIGTPFVIGAGLNPVGRDHKGVGVVPNVVGVVPTTRWAGTARGFGTVLRPFGPFLAYVGPLSAPGANGALLSGRVTTESGADGEIGSRTVRGFDYLTQGYLPKVGGCPDRRTHDITFGPTPGPPACFARCLLN